MVLKLRIEQKQVQKLILAPALQQAIKLLPLTNLELIEIIDTEISQNPMLEVDEETTEEKPEEEAQEDLKISEGVEDEQKKAQEDVEIGETQESPAEEQDLDYESYFQEYFDNGIRTYFSEEKESPALENILSKSPSLWDHLNWQANLTFFDEKDREVAQYIIGNINEDGYLTVSGEEIAKRTDVNMDKINDVREKIKKFDPIGAGSLTLGEALLAQMDYFEIKDKITRTIVSEHLHFLEKSNFSQLARILNISLSAV